MKKSLLLFGAVSPALAAFAVPRIVESPTLHRLDSHPKVTVTYSLTAAPAIVTMDVQTNVVVAGEETWVSIGGANITSGENALTGEVYKAVTNAGPHEISWRPDRSWPAEQGTVNPRGDTVRVVLTAWPTNDPPPYMVVDLATGGRTFYPGEEFLPGGLLANESYRTNSLVMRKIEARDMTWTMGSIGEYGRDVGTNDEPTKSVTMTNDYYIGVFPVTQRQYAEITGMWPSKFSMVSCRDMRPVESVSYNWIRFSKTGNYSVSDVTNHEWPHPPLGDTFPGILRTRTGGIVFDLPTEEQWEFACRAGHYEGEWGNGAPYELDGSDAKNEACAIGRNGNNVSNSGVTDHESEYDATRGTAICGSYPPNSWGLYDMHGNVREWTVNTYNRVEFNEKFAGVPGMTPINAATGMGIHSNDIKCVRGGNWNSPAYRMRAGDRSNFELIGTGKANLGFRVVCPAVVPVD